MDSNIIKLSLGSSILLLLVISCQDNNNPIEKTVNICKYYRYDAHQIVSNLGCQNCHLPYVAGQKDDRGWATFNDLAIMDSLKLVNYTFTKKHKGWYSKTGTYKEAKMDTLNECEIKSVIRYIKDSGRDIPMSSQ